MGFSEKKTSRRSIIKSLFASAAAFGAGLLGIAEAKPRQENSSNAITRIPDQDQVSGSEPPLFSSSVTHNGLIYLAGKGYHEEGDITKHTTEVLDALVEELKKAGSSMEQVIKVNVYLADLNDYDAMNEVYRGRFGENPPVRTTVACYGGIPGESLVEIDCIAALNEE